MDAMRTTHASGPPLNGAGTRRLERAARVATAVAALCVAVAGCGGAGVRGGPACPCPVQLGSSPTPPPGTIGVQALVASQPFTVTLADSSQLTFGIGSSAPYGDSATYGTYFTHPTIVGPGIPLILDDFGVQLWPFALPITQLTTFAYTSPPRVLPALGPSVTAMIVIAQADGTASATAVLPDAAAIAPNPIAPVPLVWTGTLTALAPGQIYDVQLELLSH